MEATAHLTGVVAEIAATEGEAVAAEATVLTIEAMKMHHDVVAPAAGTVRDLAVGVGDHVREGERLFRVETRDGADEERADAPNEDLTAVRADLAEALERRRLLGDEARPEAVERRRERGRRTARENVADLCDEGSFVEYGGLAVAAQRARRPMEELIERTPADGIVTGVGSVNGALGNSSASRCAVLAYDATVLAGTQGIRGHRKADRMLELAERELLPVVLFAEGGGGRPGDTDGSELFLLVVPTFASFARLSGLVPRVGIVSGRCFAGNASLLGLCDVTIATPDATVGMGGPAMIEGGGLGNYAPDEVGPVAVQEPNGVIDLVAADDAAAVAAARRALAFFQHPSVAGTAAESRLLRTVVPEDPKRVHDLRRLLELLADEGSVLELRRTFGRGILTALARIDGRAVGVIANDPSHLSGAIDAEAADKAARFVQLCDAFGLPVVSLIDTPGFMVGPEAERSALVRRSSRLFTAAATASVPFIAVVVRRAYGLGAQAMAGGSLHAPLLTLAWPSAEFGAMGVEGAVRLALRRELEAIEDPEERERRVAELVASVRAESRALNMAAHFEVDDVIDPAETRAKITAALASVDRARPGEGRRRTMVDTS